MVTPNEPRREHPSTYVVQDRSNEEEMNRLRIQDQMITTAMGGVLPEQANRERFHRILDVGCGSGSWIIEAAQAYPDMSLYGVDISIRMVEYAREQAAAQGVADRVKFQMMDALRMLEFPNNYFDLTNLRFSVSFMRKWDWPKMLSELQRVTRPGGVVRVTELDMIHQSNSPALTRLCEMFQCALARAGHLFEEETTGITAHLASLLHQHGVQQIQTRAYALEYLAGTPQGQAYYEDMKYAFRTCRPFLQKWGCLSQDFNAVYQQALNEMQRSDFCVTLHLLTVWGNA
jgi:ubiquinone/menaquinone biosynthesis C-methylase UbiE